MIVNRTSQTCAAFLFKQFNIGRPLCLFRQHARLSFEENLDPQILRPIAPQFWWTDKNDLKKFINAVDEFKEVHVDRRQRMDDNLAICDYFLHRHWKMWNVICEHPSLKRIAMYLLSKLEETMGVRTTPLKGNHRIASSFMWANIVDHMDKPWIPSAFRCLFDAFVCCCLHDDQNNVKERLTISPDTYLCDAYILPLYDTDFTRTFGRRDNQIKHGSRLEHDIHIFALDVHSSRHVDLFPLMKSNDGYGFSLSHVPVWFDSSQYPNLAQLLRSIYDIHFRYLLGGKPEEARLAYVTVQWRFLEDIEHHALHSLGADVMNSGLDQVSFLSGKSTKGFLFGLGKILSTAVRGAQLMKHHFTRAEHENYGEWNEERKHFMYVADYDEPILDLQEHYALCFLQLVHEVIIHPSALLLLPAWLKIINEKCFLNDSIVQLFQHAQLSGRDGSLESLEHSKMGTLFVDDESKYAGRDWKDARGDIVSGLCGGLRMAMNDVNKDVLITSTSYSAESTPTNGVGRLMKWYLNAMADYHAGLPCESRVNGPLLHKNQFRFFSQNKDLHTIQGANGPLVCMKNFQRITDTLIRHPSVTVLGDLISFTYVHKLIAKM